tara:strand:- start:1476 stop:2810 length:1335 start_codon:yes stop_codon:yes gene_type:complete
MNYFYKIITFLDIGLSYVRTEPLNYPTNTSFLNLMKVLIFYIFNFNSKKFVKVTTILIFFLIINILKVFYLPLIIIVYFSKYRFVQINYFQFGTTNLDLQLMVRKNTNNGYKSIILIPNYSKFYYLKKIFKNLTIINNNFFNILLLPIKHSSLVSVKAEEVNIILFDSNLDFVEKNSYTNIINKGQNKIKELFAFKERFNKEMKKLLKKNFSKFDLSKTIILHHRENFYNKTSGMRGSDLKNYLPSIKYLLKKGFGVIRLSNTHSKKLIFKNIKYAEINIDEAINQLLQYYLISKCRGFICTDSGPSVLGTMFNKPTYDTNIAGLNVAGVNSKSIFILKKVKLHNKFLTFNELIDLEYYKALLYSRKADKLKLRLVQNTPEEILQGLKEFIGIKNHSKQTRKQKQFKNSLPDYIEMKHYKSNISKFFLKKNSAIFIDSFKAHNK